MGYQAEPGNQDKRLHIIRVFGEGSGEDLFAKRSSPVSLAFLPRSTLRAMGHSGKSGGDSCR